ncbi:hypothetical protein PRZ48_007550 [Zasmidium cellare]|uniref:Glutathione S-transferase n=1 Tax=Zasmidium cellare TaxID=395010 RepID=A0ABR0EKP9_ZASCE|nr:hypothetical protein PRZ48_007550 [Zasmidium cellare]
MSLTLISATPSPYARLNRIALLEKHIPFTLHSEIPWHKSETQTPKYNPLEKLPVLIFPDRDPIYDSSLIQEYIVGKYADQGPRLVTGDWEVDMRLRQVQVLGQGVMDAVVLKFFETARGKGKASKEWEERQERKIQGGFRAFEELVKNRPQGGEYLFGDELTIADIAVGCAVGFVKFNGALGEGWEERFPSTARWFAGLDERESFRSTRPVMFDIKPDQVI